jgi:hypothetical protein
MQVDGTTSIAEQERQLQFVETFFVEVIDYLASSSGNNDVTTKAVSAPLAQPIQLKQVADASELATVAGAASAIVFDRVVFVLGARQRVVGFRA